MVGFSGSEPGTMRRFFFTTTAATDFGAGAITGFGAGAATGFLAFAGLLCALRALRPRRATLENLLRRRPSIRSIQDLDGLCLPIFNQ